MTKIILVTVAVIICILAISAGYYVFIFDAAVADRLSYGGYYEFPDQSVEAAVCHIRYTRIKDALGYGWMPITIDIRDKR